MSLFLPRHANPALRLVCLPCAGAGIADYVRWTSMFPADVEVLPARLPGREARLAERPYRSMSTLVSDLADALPVDRPYVLYGHSMGSWLAFELTRELRRRGSTLPRHLHLAARRAPDVPTTDPPLGRLPRAEFLSGMQARYGAIPATLLNEPAVLDAFLPGLRADVTLLDDHVHLEEPALDVPFTVWLGCDDRTVARPDAERWARHSTVGCVIREVPGGHFFHREPGPPGWIRELIDLSAHRP
jgi:medium-chain acyl-[acyl-carrier-protein] hydrolase